MIKIQKIPPKSVVLILTLAIFIALLATGCNGKVIIQEILTNEQYTYVNPDESKAEPDAGFVIDGILDEKQYLRNNWLYLSNHEGGTGVEIAMTSYFGDKGMYFVYDVTEETPIYVNLDRPSYLNSCIEMYLAPSKVNNMKGNSVFEIDLLPSGDMIFKKSNGKGGYVEVSTTNDIMAYLGTTTKGGELNTEACYGYCLELFIPWEYMDKFDLDAASMKESYVYAGPAHITSFNYTGTNMNIDRYWYTFTQQNGASYSNVYQYFRFDGNGVQGTVPVELQTSEHYTIEGANAVIPGMHTNVTITPDAGYALNSILINEQEYIQEADFNADGSVTIRNRGVAGGMKISAAAEPVTEGHKTVTGTVIANKLGGGDLQNVSASYNGPNGEKLLQLDADGKFTLTDLKQGPYTIILEKEGYQKLTRNIYVNWDMEVVMSLEYDLFAATGYGWVLDEQNDGILHKFGGSGELLTNEKYKNFTVSATFRYDEELEKLGVTDVFKEQRQGLKIAFDNGKSWHIDLLKQDGKYYVQYAKHSGENSMTGWKKIYQLTEGEITKYTKEGVTLSVQRAGKYANVYLNGKLIALEIWDNTYVSCSAQIGFEAWKANREIVEIPYNITAATSVNLYNTYFKMKDGWDVSRQYNGLVAMPNGGTGRLTFIDKMGNMDLTVRARDYQNSKDEADVYPRTDILFVFDNGKQISFGIDGKGTKVQSMFDDSAADKYINTGWKSWGNLTDEEITQLRSDGIDFRVVRFGTEVTLYIGDRMVAFADLTENGSGVTADMKATVSIRHYDDTGVRVEMPFELDKRFDPVTLTTGDNLIAEKQQYFVGDTVKIQAKDENSHIVFLKINGEEVPVNVDGTYSFVATEEKYTITGEVAKSIFKSDSQWDLQHQNNGVISIPVRTDSYASLYTTDNIYRDVAVTVSDLKPEKDANGKGNFQMQIRFILANGKQYQIRLHNTNKVDTYEIQPMGGDSCVTGWKWLATLTAEQAEKIRNEGIKFRVALVGTDARVYLDGVEAAIHNIGADAIPGDATAQIRFMMYGNNNVQNIVIPYELGVAPRTASIALAGGIVNGKITTGKKDNVAVVGEKIILTVTPDPGYNLVNLNVTQNGKAVDIGEIVMSGGVYSFTAEEGEYSITAEFASGIFLNSEHFDLQHQHEGIVTLLTGSSNARTLKTEANIYREIAVTVRDREKGVFKTEFHFTFANGKSFQIRLDNEKGYYRVQNMAASIVNSWKNVYSLTDAQSVKLKSEQGIEFRVAIVGTSAVVYLDSAEVGTLDLSAGITKETAQIAVVLYGNDGVKNIAIPFKLAEGSEAATIQVNAATNGIASVNKKICVPGDTITVTATPAEGYNLKRLTVKKDGVVFKTFATKLVGGDYSFQVPGVGSYTVDAEFAKALFKDDAQWNLEGQYDGVIAIPQRTGSYASLYTSANNYREASVKVCDYAPTFNADGSGNFQMQIRFIFANGKQYQIRIHNTDKDGKYKVQNMGGTNCITGWKWLKDLSASQTTAIQDGSGVEFRVVLVGSNAEVYLDSTKIATVDLSGGGVTADTPAQIRFIMYGNNDVENISIPFTLG